MLNFRFLRNSSNILHIVAATKKSSSETQIPSAEPVWSAHSFHRYQEFNLQPVSCGSIWEKCWAKSFSRVCEIRPEAVPGAYRCSPQPLHGDPLSCHQHKCNGTPPLYIFIDWGLAFLVIKAFLSAAIRPCLVVLPPPPHSSVPRGPLQPLWTHSPAAHVQEWFVKSWRPLGWKMLTVSPNAAKAEGRAAASVVQRINSGEQLCWMMHVYIMCSRNCSEKQQTLTLTCS